MIVYLCPFTFLLLLAIQKNKKDSLRATFSIKDWKTPLCHMIICILFALMTLFQPIQAYIGSQQFLILLIGLLVQAFNEEYVFRYYCLCHLHYKDISKCILITSLLFTALHYVMPENLVTLTSSFWIATLCHRFLLSILFSNFYVSHHSIYEVTILHFITNMFALIYPEYIYLYTSLLCVLLFYEKRKQLYSWLINMKNSA